MSHPNPEWNSTDAAEAPPTRERNASMTLLWVIALVAVAAALLAWYKQPLVEPAAPQANLPPITAPVTEPPAEDSAAAKATAARTAKADARRAEARRTAAASSRAQAPRPLAGNPSPKYPAAALRAGIGGTVMVRAQVDASGQPIDVDVIRRSGNRDLDRAALAAVRKWRFEPALRNGKPVAATVQVPVDFKPI